MTTKEIRKMLSKKLFCYHELKQKLQDREDEIMNNTKTNVNSYLKSKNSISRTTEDMAIKLAEDKTINYYKMWIDAIDEFLKVLESYPDELRIIKYRYIDNDTFAKDKDVMRKLQLNGEYPDYKSQYYNYKNRALDLFEKICIKRGIIDIYEKV